MNDGTTDDGTMFFEMAREFPVRTGVYTFSLPVFALLQFLNGFVHEGPLAYIGLFGVLVVVFSVMLTRYHVSVYRREKFGEW
ncbi:MULTISPECIES: hypothetical protein [Halorussus]|uniref:hypothetical protein n=1 Tax=Halorussus TaxID=1070314 RepID=UPI0020A20741|nr:hypothetical protein [Halorussus vallis]USZ74911.1 hypothetical protein NGM07_15905 [Halorussus vallis]